MGSDVVAIDSPLNHDFLGRYEYVDIGRQMLDYALHNMEWRKRFTIVFADMSVNG